MVCAKCSQLVLLYSSNSVEKPFYEITENKKVPTNISHTPTQTPN